MNKTVNKIGFWSGLVAFIATVTFVFVQLLQLTRVLTFPMDEVLIYRSSLCIVIPFVSEILALHYVTPDAKKFYSHAALIFAILYSVFVTANYVVQLATVVPMKLKGAESEIGVLAQTPHSMFWDFDALGYIFMGLTTLVAIPIFKGHGFQKWVRISFFGKCTCNSIDYICIFLPLVFRKVVDSWFSLGYYSTIINVDACNNV